MGSRAEYRSAQDRRVDVSSGMDDADRASRSASSIPELTSTRRSWADLYSARDPMTLRIPARLIAPLLTAGVCALLCGPPIAAAPVAIKTRTIYVTVNDDK